MGLKPQDVVVALKLCAYPGARSPLSVIANDLSISPSEVHCAIRRLRASRLLITPGLQDRPNISALEEFLIHGLMYVFPARHGEVTRGIPTSYAAEPLKSEMAMSNDLPPGWPWPSGDTRGVGLEPLYRKLPQAALRDPELYQLLALVDAIRDWRARERKIAEQNLVRRIRTTHARP